MDDTSPVRISSTGDLAAALPHLVGFRPRESVVLLALGGPGGRRLGLTARADLPGPGVSLTRARELARTMTTDDAEAVVVAVVSEAPDVPEALPGQPAGCGVPGLPHRAVVRDLVFALGERGLAVPEVLLVRGGRWWSYDCPLPCCAPGAGQPVPEGGEYAAAAVLSGVVVEADRAALQARIAPADPAGTRALEAATWRVADRQVRARRRDPAGAERASWRAVTGAVARCRPGPGSRPLADRELAGVLWAVADTRVRDRALGFALGEDAAAAEVLWTECTRRAPAPFDAPPATLLAVSAWLRGDGAMANVALQRALASRPGYGLAELLSRGLAACLPPAELRALVTAAVADVPGVPAG
ncbi:DUF4192 domain-containing protein [Geodermatophilus marinus]|uniref:DUF4192 domain-containing protein n=1 Tax=Geodermatophilus sp. LHW52908 TaxID=2303986 RepID=UPI000E3DA302|nr:DUF4192 domain-containing protein [Geodermatophilus sp. LHW52908]RFU19841.1 DUF4192 domain-containing protein [Geodermatophilus sp. LHW52908]